MTVVGTTLMMFFSALCGLYGMWLISILLYLKSRSEKISVYECGFLGEPVSRIPFSLRFFFLLLLFVVFDVELAFVAQLPFQQKFFFKNRLLFVTFFLVMLAGFLEEWRRGMLDWSTS